MKLRHLSRALLTLLALAAASEARAQDAARGATLMAAARQAIGGQNTLSGVKTLQMTGTFRRVIGTNDTEGDVDIFLELPNKYLRSEKTGTPGQPSTETIEALVGTEPRDVVRGGGGRGGRGGGNIGGGDAAAGGDAAPPADGGDAAAGGGDAQPAATPAPGGGGRGGFDPEAGRRTRQADVARLTLMLFLTSDVPIAWVGIAESPDGKADVLEARFADGQPTRLFLDITSHLPLMLQWQSVPAPAGGRRGGQRGGGGGGRGQGQPGAAAPAPITNDMTFTDHREVNGIRFPYVITKGTNGQTFERWTVTRYRVNPSFNAETFRK